MNYHFGYFLGPKVLRSESSRWLNHRHLERTQRFFDRYGARTIILARFVPIVRTFAPFVAGVGTMQYRRFLLYNVVGGTIWVIAFLVRLLVWQCPRCEAELLARHPGHHCCVGATDAGGTDSRQAAGAARRGGGFQRRFHVQGNVRRRIHRLRRGRCS